MRTYTMNRYGLTSKDRRLKATSLFLVLALSLSVTQAKSIVAPNDSSTGVLRQTLSVAGGAMIYQEPNTAWQVVAVGDLNGDHRDDLIWWNNVTGQVYGMLMNGVVRQQEGMLYREPDTAWRIVVARDITGDGQADLLWRNTNTGQVYLMPMNGLTIAGGAMIYHEPNLNWSIVAVGDLNNDQRDDLIWWYSNTGQVYGMLMNGYFISAQGMTYHEPNTAWQIISSGDYTGDGKADLLWRNSQTGQIYEMPMNGLAVAGGQQIYQEANANWRIVANAGVSFLPQPSRSLPGATRFAPLEGEPLNPYQPLEGEPLNPNLLSAQSLSSQTLTTFDVPQIKISPQFSPLSTNALLHSGDYNGDGKADLIWQNVANGQVYEILLDGFNIIQQGMIYHEPNTAWRIVGNGDFTGNGHSDLLWWNSSTGQVYLMTMGATNNPSPNTYTLTVNKTGTGSGAVTGTGIDCGSDCTESYNQGATVTLIATAASGSTFAGWSGACTNTTGNCVVSMTSAQSVIANFILGDPVTTLIFNDFSSVAGLTLNNAATTTSTYDGSVLRLTPASSGQAGSAFSTNKIRATGFSTSFQFRITNPGGGGADGLVFVIQNVSSNSGGAGEGIGYSGIDKSVGVEFDTWHNSSQNDPNSNHLGIDINGDVNHGIGSPNTLNVSPDFDDGNVWFAWIDYDGAVLEVRVNQTGIRPSTAMLTRALDIPAILGDTHAYVGFTSATGAAWGNHDIIRWEYRDLSGQDDLLVLINSDINNKSDVQPYVFLTEEGSIYVPYVNRNGDGAPTSTYGFKYISPDGEILHAFLDPTTGFLTTLYFTDAIGRVKVDVKNYDSLTGKGDLIITYEDGTTDARTSVQLDLIAMPLNVQVASKAGHAPLGIAEDLEKLLDDYSNELRKYAEEHYERAMGWVSRIGSFFDRFRGRAGRIATRIRDGARHIGDAVVERITHYDNQQAVDNAVESANGLPDTAKVAYRTPDASEICGDGDDNDQNGQIDEGCSFEVSIYLEDNQCPDDVIGLEVDGKNYGNTPEGKGRQYNLSNLQAGNHTLTVVAISSAGSRFGCSDNPIVSYGLTYSGGSDSGEIEVGSRVNYSFTLTR